MDGFRPSSLMTNGRMPSNADIQHTLANTVFQTAPQLGFLAVAGF
jgi:hypothetical protein